MADEAQRQFGALLREWRQRRHMSQLDLALRVDVSTRHLSYVETGRSHSSPGIVNRLGAGLDLAPRERNTLFIAAGYAPAYGRRLLRPPELTQVSDVLRRVLDRHQPYPAIVFDSGSDVLDAKTRQGRRRPRRPQLSLPAPLPSDTGHDEAREGLASILALSTARSQNLDGPVSSGREQPSWERER